MRAYNVEFGVPEEINQQIQGLIKQTHAPSVLLLGMLESAYYDQDPNVHVSLLRALAEAFYTRNHPYDRQFAQRLQQFATTIEAELQAMEA